MCERVADIVTTLTAEYEGTVSVDVPADLTLRTQPVLLGVVVTNLVENALQHVADATVAVRARVEGDEMVLTVADDGPGVPDHELSVLERGRETEPHHGSGLGLWLAQWAAQMLDGDLDFETGDGTTATVRLPLESRRRQPGGVTAGRTT